MSGPCIGAQRVSGRIIAYSVKTGALVVLTLREAAQALTPADFDRVTRGLR